MLSGRGLCDELIARPEESYRPWCVVVCDLETSRIGAPYIYDISSLRVKHVFTYPTTPYTSNELTSPRTPQKLYNQELTDLYSSPNIIRVIKSRRMIWAGHVARTGERRRAYRVLVWKPEGKRQLGRTKRTWENNIKTNLQEVA